MKEQTKKKLSRVGWLLFYLYIMLLSYFLFLSEHYGRDYIIRDYRYNLEFFKEIKRFIEYRKQLGMESFTVNILGNILAFAPFGFFLSALNRRYRNFFSIVILSILFSLSAETIQLVLRVGIFDVDDIMLNTIGGIVGYLFYVILCRIIRKVSHKNGKSGRK